MARIGDLLATLLRRRTPDGDPLPDYVLLDRFAHTRDPAAFELLVWRHGPMVLAACRRVLRDAHAAEDAFQAVFLILAKKAGTVRGSAPGWLHRVALRVCLRMKRRRVSVSRDTDPVSPATVDSVEAGERAAILDEEVARLPDWLRVPVVVCYLQGLTTERASEVLGIPRGTVLSRLATARKRLAVRLTARGVAPLVAAVAVSDLSADAGRAVAESAVGFALDQSTNSVPVQLALEVLAMTKRTTMMAVAAGVLILTAGLGTGVGFVAAQGQGAKPTPTTAPAAVDPKKPPAPITPRDSDNARRENIEKLLATVDKQLQVNGPEDVDSLRRQLVAAESRLTELSLLSAGGRLALPPELEDELAKADERLDAAKVARMPADVLAEAVKMHPKVVALQTKLSAKEDEARKSKLPKDDAGRKKLDEERVALFKDVQAVRAEVGSEVEAYLRAPAIVEAQKARSTADRKLKLIVEQADRGRQEYLLAQEKVKELRDRLAKCEPLAEEVAWLKEKRKRLKQELLELELKELGIGK